MDDNATIEDFTALESGTICFHESLFSIFETIFAFESFLYRNFEVIDFEFGTAWYFQTCAWKAWLSWAPNPETRPIDVRMKAYEDGKMIFYDREDIPAAFTFEFLKRMIAEHPGCNKHIEFLKYDVFADWPDGISDEELMRRISLDIYDSGDGPPPELTIEQIRSGDF